MSVSEVVHNARCELYNAVRENRREYPWIENWGAGFTFTFVVDRDANASTDTTYLIPIQLGSFSIGLRANLKQKATATYALGFKITQGLGKFSEADCDQPPSDSPLHRKTLLSGEIGLQRWIGEVAPQIHNSGIANARKDEPKEYAKQRGHLGAINELTYTIEFGITADGSILPSWRLTYPDKDQFSPGLNLTVSEVVKHKLIVALTPIPARDDPKDLTGIVSVGADGKEVIVGRRVCIMNEATSKQCLDHYTKAEAEAQKALELAKSDKALIVQQQQVLERQAEEQRKSVAPSPALRQLPTSQILRMDPGTIRQLNIPDQRVTDEVLKIGNQYKVLESQRRDADRKVIEAQEDLKQARQVSGDDRRAAELAATRAREAMEAEVSRRLDQLIQQQIIRDAFR